MILTIACLAGYIWLYVNVKYYVNGSHEIGVCIIKHTTNVPCPSCGSTRSVLSAFQGNIAGAFMLNPFGLIIVVILIVSPVWILSDKILKKESFWIFYQKMEQWLKIKPVAFMAILLVLANWIWNIYKDV